MRSYVYGAGLGAGIIILAQFIDGRVAVLIGLTLFVLLSRYLGAPVEHEPRQVFGPTARGRLRYSFAEPHLTPHQAPSLSAGVSEHDPTPL